MPVSPSSSTGASVGCHLLDLAEQAAEGDAAADDRLEALHVPDLAVQHDVLGLEPVLQLPDLGQRLPQCRFILLALSDVDGDAQHAIGSSAGPVVGLPAHCQPADGAVGQLHPTFCAEAAPFAADRVDLPANDQPILGVDNGEQLLDIDVFSSGEAELALGALGGTDSTRREVEVPESGLRGRYHQVEAGVSLPQLLVRSLALDCFREDLGDALEPRDEIAGPRLSPPDGGETQAAEDRPMRFERDDDGGDRPDPPQARLVLGCLWGHVVDGVDDRRLSPQNALGNSREEVGSVGMAPDRALAHLKLVLELTWVTPLKRRRRLRVPLGVVGMGEEEPGGVARSRLPKDRPIDAESVADVPLRAEDLFFDPVGGGVHQLRKQIPEQIIEPGELRRYGRVGAHCADRDAGLGSEVLLAGRIPWRSCRTCALRLFMTRLLCWRRISPSKVVGSRA